MKTDQQILDAAERSFTARFRPKFEDGMRKYVTPITEKDCIAEAEVEVLDLWAYLHAERARRDEAFEIACLLHDWYCEHKQYEDRPSSEHARWQQLLSLLSTKPLAKKKPLSDEGCDVTAGG